MPTADARNLVWRIVAVHRAARAFDGEGARRHGGRWNHHGVAVVYAASTLSLAALELLVHLDVEDAPERLVSLSAELPSRVEVPRLDFATLGRGWRTYPAPDRLKDIGSDWIRSGASLALAVPSAVVPSEWNVLLNPAHRDFLKLRIGKPARFSFDPRLWK